MDKKKLAQWLMAPLTIILVLLLLTQVSLSDIISALASVNPLYLAASFILFILLYVTRALRFCVMLNVKDLAGMFNIVCTHSMANNVVPFRAGELAFVYLAKMRMGISMGVGMAVIALSRLYDVLAICILFIASLLLAREGFGYFSGFVPFVAALALALALLIIAIVWLNKYFAAFTRRVFSIKVLDGLRTIPAKVDEICGYCSSLRTGRSTAAILAITMAMWAFQALNMYLISSGMGLGLNFWTAVVGMLLAIVLIALPIQGVGNFGSFELAWAAIFVALGAPVAAAVSSGFAVHLIILFFTTILWVYGMVADRFHKEVAAEESPAH